ncbi:hypothetical protein T265_06280 [Opisthorchis viverrini]|uniref:Uncharacterized protein n=1 Tax=Opisthorchis viverrini TaxID=6198 RepID=A0A074ZGT5_OPIVI|nr:hypothetical protein T265_06280 [Opisthorchis viverrini]KER26491.1 hypothetical protein T265_06280 [Opisthorchis viverrini]
MIKICAHGPEQRRSHKRRRDADEKQVVDGFIKQTSPTTTKQIETNDVGAKRGEESGHNHIHDKFKLDFSNEHIAGKATLS